MAILYDNEGNQITMSEVNANASDITDLKSRMTTAEGDITSLDGRLDTAEPKISTLETTTNGLVANKEILGAKNMLPLTLSNLKTSNTAGTWNNNVYSSNGLTYTVSIDDTGNVTSITLTGGQTATSASYFMLASNLKINGECYLNGCPSGGGYGKYRLYTESPQIFDDGNGAIIDYSSDFSVVILIYAGYTIPDGDLTFYPMIRLATDNNPTFAPYAMGNQELTQKVLDLEARVTALET